MLLDLWSFGVLLNDLSDFIGYIFEHGSLQLSPTFILVSFVFLAISYFAWRSTDVPNDLPPPPRPPYVIQIQGSSPRINFVPTRVRVVPQLPNQVNYTNIHINRGRTPLHFQQQQQRNQQQQQQVPLRQQPTSQSHSDAGLNPTNPTNPIPNTSSTSSSTTTTQSNQQSQQVQQQQQQQGPSRSGGGVISGLFRRTIARPLLPLRPLVRSRLNASPNLIVYHRVNVYHTTRNSQQQQQQASSTTTTTNESVVGSGSEEVGDNVIVSQEGLRRRREISNNNTNIEEEGDQQQQQQQQRLLNVVNVDVNVDVDVELSESVSVNEEGGEGDLIIDSELESSTTTTTGAEDLVNIGVGGTVGSGSSNISDNLREREDNLGLGLSVNFNVNSNTFEEPTSISNNNSSVSSISNNMASSSQSQTDNSRISQGQGQQQPRQGQEERRKEEDVKITLKFLNDTQMDVVTQLSEKVIDFKRRHFSAELEENKIVRLIFNGRVLEDNTKTLREAGIFDACTVHCLIVTPQPQQTPNNVANGTNSNSSRNRAGRGPEPGIFFITIIGIVLIFLWFICFHFGPQLFTQSAVVSLTVLTAIFLIGLVAFYLPIHPNQNN